ncbi:MAG: TIGR03619 family F420-dependent LLM class oxidoreductase [Deltaproteobacteria bacterium]|nr:TIGR03619 family F420-dependent LLM class oxidoreductase [Deltaproteobacteria bacterium]
MATGSTSCGIAMPQVFINPPVDIRLIRNFLLLAETLAYDSVWVQEQIIGDFAILEPVSLLNFAAALTSRLRLGTSVLLTVLRNPVQLAKSLSTLDHLSRGRLTVGIGLGVDGSGAGNDSIFGATDGRRVRRFVESIEVMKALWTEPAASFQGSFWRFQEVAMEPKPVQKPHPPIWFGAHREPALRRAVKYGDGWMGAGSSSTTTFIKESALLRRLLDEARRDPATFTVSKRVYIAVDDDRQRAERRLREWFAVRYKSSELASRVAVWGNRSECVDKLREIVHAGANHLLLNPVFQEMEHLELLAKEVIPHL